MTARTGSRPLRRVHPKRAALCHNRSPTQSEDAVQRVVAATALQDLRVPSSHRLKALRGDRAGRFSIRINDQWRVCFIWTDQGAAEIEVIDYQ